MNKHILSRPTIISATLASLAAIGLGCALALALVSCAFAAPDGDVATLTVTVSTIGAATSATASASDSRAPARAITADFSSIVDGVTVTLTDAAGATHVTGTGGVPTAARNGDGSWNASISGITPGAGSVTAVVYSNGVAIGSATTTVTLASGGTVSTALDVTYYRTAGGTGGFSLDGSWPAGLGIDSVVAGLVNASTGAAASPAPTVTLHADGLGATIAAANVPSGVYDLALTFYAGAAIVGYATDTVNVWDGVTSDRWLDTSSANAVTSASRAFTAEELTVGTSLLGGLVFTGLAEPFTFNANVSVQATGLSLNSTVSFVATRGIAGQTIEYAWGTGSSYAEIPSDSAVMLAIGDVVGGTTLRPRVTAPVSRVTREYSINLAHAYTVRFDDAGAATSVDPQYVAFGGLVSVPTAPTRAGFTLAGWYADPDYAAAWDFDADTVIADRILYAKWVSGIGVTVDIASPTLGTLSFSDSASTPVSSLTLIPGEGLTISAASSLGSGGTWAWQVTGLGLSGTGTHFSISYADTINAVGTYQIICELTKGGIRYAGQLPLVISRNASIVVYDKGDAFSGTVPTASARFSWDTTVAAASADLALETDPENPTPVWQFWGWNTKADGSGTRYEAGSPIACTGTVIKLYPEWKAAVANAVDLQAALLTLSGVVEITAPIVLSGAQNCWVPVGTSANPYQGMLLGNGYDISNVNLSLSGADYRGFIGYAGASAVIRDVRLSNASVTNGTHGNTGALVGGNNGKVIGCSATGTVSGPANIGGLVGTNWGTISESYSLATVNNTASYYHVGGLVGQNCGGVIENCYARGAINSLSQSSAGLVGWNQGGGIVRNCYSTGLLTASSVIQPYWGGVVGEQVSSLTNGYYDSVTSGTVAGGSGTAKTSDQLKAMSLGEFGWSSSVWARNPRVNDGYPYLKRFNPYSVGFSTYTSIAQAAGFTGGSLVLSGDLTAGDLAAIRTLIYNSSSSVVLDLSATTLTSIPASQFASLNNLNTVILPASITSIGESAFARNYGLGTVIGPNTAFSQSIDLSGLTNLATIGDNAFYNCSATQSIKLPASLASIGELAFYQCFSVYEISVAASDVALNIGNYAFQGCANDMGRLDVICLRTAVPTIGSGIFDVWNTGTRPITAAGLSIKVPTAKVSAYQVAANWSAYATSISAY